MFKNILVITVILFFFFVISAWYVYGIKEAFMVMLILWPLTSFLAMVGVIPIVGQIVYWVVAKKIIFPMFFSWFEYIEPSWVTETVFFIGMVYNISFAIAFLVVMKSE